jgi:CRP/FNR family cyclic AMP-dependent transcriptional regulator
LKDLDVVLADHPFFEGLSPEQLQFLAGCASNVRFEPGAFLYREGDEANNFFVLREGKVAIEAFSSKRGAITIQTLTDGDVLGWSWLFPPYYTHFGARAIELTRAISLDGKCLRKKCEEDHDLGYELMKRFSEVMIQRLQATRLQLLDLYGEEG